MSALMSCIDSKIFMLHDYFVFEEEPKSQGARSSEDTLMFYESAFPFGGAYQQYSWYF